MLAALVCVPASIASPSAAAEPVRVLIVGDSVSQGSSGDWTWRYRLWQHLQATAPQGVDLVGPRTDLWDYLADQPGSHDYVDPAFDQDHAARWGMLLANADVPIDDLVEEYQPDVVVEMLGTNDLLYAGPPANIKANIENFVASARSADAGVNIVLSEVTQTWFPDAPELNAKLAEAAGALDSIDSRVLLADTDAGYTNEGDTFDGSHPNARGEVKIAAAVADQLALLGVGTAPIRPLPQVPLGPRIPSVLSGVAAEGQISLGWTRSPGAATAQVQRRDDTAGGAWSVVADAEPGTTYVPTDIPFNHQMQFRILPRKGNQLAAPDVASNVVTLSVPSLPGRPRPTVEVRGPRSAKVSWRAVARAATYTVELRRAGRVWKVVAVDRVRSRLVLRGLRPGATYDVRVTARNSTGAGPTSRRVRFTLP